MIGQQIVPPDQPVRLISKERRQIEERLMTLKPGEFVTYQELNRIAGKDVQFKYRYLLHSAIQAIHRKRCGIVLRAEWNVGIYRMTDGENIDSAPKLFTQIRRKTRKARSRLTNIEALNNLTQQQLAQMRANDSVLGIMLLASKPSSREKVKRIVNSSSENLPSMEVLKRLAMKPVRTKEETPPRPSP